MTRLPGREIALFFVIENQSRHEIRQRLARPRRQHLPIGFLPPRVVGFHEQVELLGPAPMLMITMWLAAHASLSDSGRESPLSRPKAAYSMVRIPSASGPWSCRSAARARRAARQNPQEGSSKPEPPHR